MGEELTREDWQKILAIPWNREQRRIIGLFHRRKNKAISLEEICRQLYTLYNGSSPLEYINVLFSKHDLPYYIKAYGQWGSRYGEKPQKIVVRKAL